MIAIDCCFLVVLRLIFCFTISLCIIADMSEVDKAKHGIIEAFFYDDDKGNGSKSTTLKHAKQIHKRCRHS
jgi:hypothetical protein